MATGPAHPAHRPAHLVRHGRSAFTLIELLVVIGIIAVLLAVLMPVLKAVRMQAERVKCAGNLRQLSVAFLMYTGDNRQYFPKYGGAGEPEDWVHWWPGGELGRSPIAKYMGGLSAQMLLCPADDPQVRPRPSLSPFHPPADPRFNYPFSYTFSIKLARRKLGSVRNPSMKLMLVDEDEGTIHAGSFFGDRSTSGPGTLWESMLANRHDPRGKRDWRQWPADVRLEQARRADKGDRGNVAFVDGHVDYVTREFTWDERHYRRELH